MSIVSVTLHLNWCSVLFTFYEIPDGPRRKIIILWLCRHVDLVSQNFDLLTQNVDVLSQTFYLQSQNLDLVIPNFELLSQTLYLLCQNFDLIYQNVDNTIL